MAEYESLVQVNLGPLASIESVTELFSDVTTMLQFAKGVQNAINRNEAQYATLRGRRWRQYLEDVDDRYPPSELPPQFGYAYFRLLALPPVPFERDRNRQQRELSGRSEISVISMAYANPFNIKISFDGGGIARILETIRDWSTNRQLARARVRVAEAAATDYEDKVRARHILRENLITSLLEDGRAVTRENVTELLADSTVDALVSLANAGASIGVGPAIEE